jgi:hypothetical protein
VGVTKWTKDKVADIIKSFYTENGRNPTSRDHLGPNKDTIIRIFGSWNSAMTYCGLCPARRSQGLTEEETKNWLERTALVDSETDCWERPNELKGEYGLMSYKGEMWYTHRLSAHLFNDDLDDDKLIRHLCNNKKCYNPKHLKVGTHSENRQDVLDLGNWKISTISKKRPYGSSSDEIWEWIRDEYAVQIDGGYSSFCWISPEGQLDCYARMFDGKQAHRWVFEYHYGSVKIVGHACHNKGCFNPTHLYNTDRSQNAKDSRNRSNIHLNETLAYDIFYDLLTIDQYALHWKSKFDKRWADKLGVSSGLISDLRRGNSWTDVRKKVEHELEINRPRLYHESL